MSSKGFTYKFKVDAEITDLIAKTNQIKQNLSAAMQAGKAPGAAQIFSSVEKALDRLQQKASQPITSAATFDSIQKDTIAAAQQLGKLEEIFSELASLSASEKIKLLPPDTKKKTLEALQALENFSKGVKEAKTQSEQYATAQADLAKATKELKNAQSKKGDAEKLVDIQSRAVQTAKEERDAIEAKVVALKRLQSAQQAAAKGEEADVSGAQKGATEVGITIDTSDAAAVTAELERLSVAAGEAKKAVTDAESVLRGYNNSLTKASNAVSIAEGKVNNLTGTVGELEKEFNTSSTAGLKKAFDDFEQNKKATT